MTDRQKRAAELQRLAAIAALHCGTCGEPIAEGDEYCSPYCRNVMDRGIAARMADHNAVRRAGGSPRAAIRAYCAGNRWLEENARAVGNW